MDPSGVPPLPAEERLLALARVQVSMCVSAGDAERASGYRDEALAAVEAGRLTPRDLEYVDKAMQRASLKPRRKRRRGKGKKGQRPQGDKEGPPGEEGAE
jgi:hypothetical protein